MIAVVHTIFVNLIVPISMHDETEATGRPNPNALLADC